MESMAAAPGFARAIAGTGPVFAAFLVRHILAGLTAISSGALVMVSRKGTERHVRAGTAYFWTITVLAATAAGLTAIRVPAAAGGGCLRSQPNCGCHRHQAPSLIWASQCSRVK